MNINSNNNDYNYNEPSEHSNLINNNNELSEHSNLINNDNDDNTLVIIQNSENPYSNYIINSKISKNKIFIKNIRDDFYTYVIISQILFFPFIILDLYFGYGFNNVIDNKSFFDILSWCKISGMVGIGSLALTIISFIVLRIKKFYKYNIIIKICMYVLYFLINMFNIGWLLFGTVGFLGTIGIWFCIKNDCIHNKHFDYMIIRLIGGYIILLFQLCFSVELMKLKAKSISHWFYPIKSQLL